MVDRNTYALLSARVYGASPDSNNVNKIFVPTGWTELPEFVDNGLTGLYARAYRNNATGEVVIAFRGTNTTISDGTIQDWQTNISAGLGYPNDQVAQAMSFYESIKATYGSNISFTGHSLGGGLAALMGVFFNKTAVTFDAILVCSAASMSVRDSIASHLLANGAITDADLASFTSDIGFPEDVPPGIRGEDKVTGLYVEGEVASYIPLYKRIGTQTPLPNGNSGLTDIFMAADLTFAGSAHCL